MNLRPEPQEEMERLLALPEDHPDRRRAEASGQLEAWRRTLLAFETPVLEPPDGFHALDRRLAERLEKALPPASDEAPNRGADRARAARLPAQSSWWALVLRPAFTVAVLVLVAGAWWLTERARTPHLRASQDATPAIELAVPGTGHGELRLSWNPVAGADAYRLEFYGPKLELLARVETRGETTLTLRGTALPAGLESGSEVMLEVTALRNGLSLASSRGRIVRLP